MKRILRKKPTVGSVAAGKWLKREKNFEACAHSVYDYHVSGHYMDGFKDGVAWQKQQAQRKKAKE